MTGASQPAIAKVSWVGRRAVVEAHGDIDLHRSATFQQTLLALLDRDPERIVIDLRNVPYMDSSGIATLVKVLSRTRKSGTDLRLFGLSARVRSLFEITRLDTVFPIAASEAEALG
jgi:anti-sigma B factor antagonist